MLIKELFESAPVNHGKVIKTLYGLAVRQFKAPAAIKADAAQVANNSDRFWVYSADDATKLLRKFLTSPSHERLAAFYDGIETVVGEIVGEMHDYYVEPKNHAPGYKVPKLGSTIVVLTPKTIDGAFADFDGYASAVKNIAA